MALKRKRLVSFQEQLRGFSRGGLTCLGRKKGRAYAKPNRSYQKDNFAQTKCVAGKASYREGCRCWERVPAVGGSAAPAGPAPAPGSGGKSGYSGPDPAVGSSVSCNTGTTGGTGKAREAAPAVRQGLSSSAARSLQQCGKVSPAVRQGLSSSCGEAAPGTRQG